MVNNTFYFLETSFPYSTLVELREGGKAEGEALSSWPCGSGAYAKFVIINVTDLYSLQQ
jgi:hypothetical protein